MSEGCDKSPMVFEWQPVNLQNPEFRLQYEYFRIKDGICDIN